MKRKKPSIEELQKRIEEMQKDPELMETARDFVIRHGGRVSSAFLSESFI